MVGYEPIMDALELVLSSKYVAGEKPVSLLLLSEAESGRTEALKKFSSNDGIIVYRRFTAFGVQQDMKEGKIKLLFNTKTKSGKKFKILPHFLIYDFNSLLSFKHDTINSTLELINAMTEEGLSKESTFISHSEDMKKFVGATGGIVAAVNTHGMFTYKKKIVQQHLYRGGFFSRPVIFSFDIPESVMYKIFGALTEEKDIKDFKTTISLPKFNKRISVSISKKYAEQILEISQEITTAYNKRIGADFKIKGIRLFKSMRTLAKCSALRDERKTVNSYDVERLRFLSNWINLDMKPLSTAYSFYDLRRKE